MKATAWPAMRTRFPANSGCGVLNPGEPSARLVGTTALTVPNPRAARSLPVRIASTPGAARAFSMSIASISACAWGERRTWARA